MSTVVKLPTWRCPRCGFVAQTEGACPVCDKKRMADPGVLPALEQVVLEEEIRLKRAMTEDEAGEVARAALAATAPKVEPVTDPLFQITVTIASEDELRDFAEQLERDLAEISVNAGMATDEARAKAKVKAAAELESRLLQRRADCARYGVRV